MTPAGAAELLGQPVEALQPLSGGQVSEVWLCDSPDGEIILKVAEGGEREARMLDAIQAAGVPCPQVIARGTGWYAMTRLAEGSAVTADAQAEAGEALARLHAANGSRFGWSEDHAMGDAFQPNGEMTDWPAFWAERRLMAWPEVLPADIARRAEALARVVPDLLPTAPPPSLLHGDLWSGNLLFGENGFSGLIDPSSYYGDGEVDLALLDLFGAIPRALAEAYGPLRAGWEARRTVYQIWPALVHLRLFGAGYRPLCERLFAECGV